MGVFHVNVDLRWRRRRARVRALVDTGSDFVVIPRTVARRLGLRPWGGIPCELADGSTRRLPAATALVRLDGREAPATVLVAPKGEVLLGAEVLETLRLVIDARRRRLKATGPFVVKLARAR